MSKYPWGKDQDGNNNDQPPGKELLGICLAAFAALIGTPYLFHYIGPFVENLVYEAYGWRELADLMYAVTFAFCGVAIYAICRLTFWYALGMLLAFLTARFGGLLVAA